MNTMTMINNDYMSVHEHLLLVLGTPIGVSEDDVESKMSKLLMEHVEYNKPVRIL